MCGCVYKPAQYWPNVGITSDINQVFLGLFSIVLNQESICRQI